MCPTYGKMSLKEVLENGPPTTYSSIQASREGICINGVHELIMEDIRNPLRPDLLAGKMASLRSDFFLGR